MAKINNNNLKLNKMNNSQKVTLVVMTITGIALVVNQVINNFNFVL